MKIKKFNFVLGVEDTLDTNSPVTLEECLSQKWVAIKDHPVEEDLQIANYTPVCQYATAWNSVTCSHRGLILKNGIAINNPLPKFFNIGQLTDGDNLMTQPFKVYEKLDGNCGILYWLANGSPQMATRGSFKSEGAEYANKHILPKVLDYVDKFDKAYTYVFEIICPTTKIVVDYGTQERLVLLAVRANDRTHELDLADIDYPDKAKLFDGWSAEMLLQAQASNTQDEGFVLLFEDGFRAKIKCTEYMRLHKILNNLNNIDVWKAKLYAAAPDQYKDYAHLADIEAVMADVPDEFYNWFKKVDSDIESQYQVINNKALDAYNQCRDLPRGEIAKLYKSTGLMHYIFNLIDGKGNRTQILKNLRPAMAVPCVVDEI